ncbi:MAG: SGNH/GDSL hydrolase family protein, partial [Thermodesulfobacteriota bacterium]|nr:SGNH/GDSL hydrolase family protein [Thermodesulfobacteriota bacterium]
NQTTFEAFGEVIVLNTDSTIITVSSFETEVRQQNAYYDNILYSIGEPFVIIAQPTSYYLQGTTNLSAQAIAGNLQAGWGVKFVLDLGTADEATIIDITTPYEAVFTDLAMSEHMLDAFVVDDLGDEVDSPSTHDTEVQIGIGDYYVAIGDSITNAYGDDDPSDDSSADGRDTGGGYEPVLNDFLTALLGYPHIVVNEGVGGAKSVDGAASIAAILAAHPNVLRLLVQYGTNDASIFFPVPSGLGLSPGDPDYPGSFKNNMQQIIDVINAAGEEACLAKVPISLSDSSISPPYDDPSMGKMNILIQEFNGVIDELVSDPANSITITPPDFYSYFEANYVDEYSDWLHPNGIGYRSMANLWLQALTYQ